MGISFFDGVGDDIPEGIDLSKIETQYRALHNRYHIDQRQIPIPVWARRPLEDNGPTAWSKLSSSIKKQDIRQGLCIYIHIPFCFRKCGYCDCYSFHLKNAHLVAHSRKYSEALIRELSLWADLPGLSQRPVTTVHLGGGTPTCLAGEDFERLIETVSRLFGVSSLTEWALESTTAELTSEVLGMLTDLGFTRLHLGLQSLQDGVRRKIGRSETPRQVRSKIESANELGWVVSVDLICGLPGQTLLGIHDDIMDFSAAGVEGVSVYELQKSRRNQGFFRRFGLNRRPRHIAYGLLHAADQILTGMGYRKTLFNHFARQRDTNLYFSFPERDEDCLAVGTISDGVLGPYHFRHPPYSAYFKALIQGHPGLLGGMTRNQTEQLLRPLETMLLSANLNQVRLEKSIGTRPARNLLSRWRNARLIKESETAGEFILTPNGSWFMGNMMHELAGMIPDRIIPP